MRRNILHLAGIFLLGVATLFTACGEEDALTPSGNELNSFLPDESDHSPVAELRRSFYEETGIYLLFSDTLRHVQTGTDEQGRPVYDTDMVDFNYNLNGDGGYNLRMEYYTTLEEMQAAAQTFKDEYLPHMGESMMLYSLLLLKNLEQDRYNEDDWEFLASVSNIYCMGVATGDLANLTEEERAATALEVFKDIVDNAISEFDWDDYEGPFYDATGEVYSGDYVDDWVEGWDRTQLEAIYELGFINYSESGRGPHYDSFYYSDWSYFFDIVMEQSWEEIEAEWGQYSIVMQRMGIVRDAILATGYVF